MLIHSITDAIGNTPLLHIPFSVHRLPGVELYVKLEMMNPFGSIKDRVGWALLREDLIDIKHEQRELIEISSGNTAKALGAVAGMNDLKLTALTNRIKVPEVRDVLLLQGVKVQELPGSSECPDPSDPNNPIVYLERAVAESKGRLFNTNQYLNERNPTEHQEKTAVEIEKDIGEVSYLFAGLGTAGSSQGVGRYFRSKYPNFKLYGVVSRSDDFLPGIRRRDEMLEVGIFQPTDYDKVLDVGSDAALEGMIELIRKCGVLAGPSTGGSYAAIKKYFNETSVPEGESVKVVFFACDRVESYLSYIKKRRPDIFQADKSKTKFRPLDEEELEDTPSLEPLEFLEMTKHEKALVVDVRHLLAFQAAKIPGSINMLDAHLEELLQIGSPFPRDSKVLLVCRVGLISRKLAALARRFGCDASSLAGGLTAWDRKGLLLERS